MTNTKRRSAIPKTRADGTLTESAFWSLIRSTLRNKSRWWRPIAICKLNAKRVYKGVKKRQKFEYQCNICKQWFPEKEVNVDHIIPAGQLNCAADLPTFVERLFCEKEGLQVLCEKCHSKKTEQENGKSFKRRNHRIADHSKS